MLLATHVLLSLRAVFSRIRLYRLGSIVGLLGGNLLDLRCLASDDLACVVETIVYSLAVLDVDKWGQIDDEGRDQSEAPEGNKLDEPVGEEGSGKDLVPV